MRYKITNWCMIIVLLSSFCAKAQDLSGSWSGHMQMYRNNFEAKLYLSEANAGQYTGILNLSGTINYQKSEATVFIAAKHSGDSLFITRVDFIEKHNFDIYDLDHTQKLAIRNSGNATLQGNDDLGIKNALSNTYVYEWKKKSIPKEYRDYCAANQSLRVDSIWYSSVNNNKVSYNSEGLLNIKITNLLPIKVTCIADHYNLKQTDPILSFNQRDTIYEGSQGIIKVPLLANYFVPSQEVQVRMFFTVGNYVFSDTTFVIPSIPFFSTTPFQSPDEKSPRLVSIAYNYGMAVYDTTNLHKLEVLAGGGDKFAKAWRAIFMFMGYGSSFLDEEKAVADMTDVLQALEQSAQQGNTEAVYLLFWAYQMNLRGMNGKNFAPYLLERAYRQGFKPAMFTTAMQYYVAKNYQSAYRLFDSCAGAGMMKAYEMMSQLPFDDKRNGISSETRLSYLKKDMDYQDPTAIIKMAEVYAEGKNGVMQDFEKAICLANQAANSGSCDAMNYLAKLSIEKGKDSVTSGIVWLKRAAARGDKNAFLSLAQIFSSDKIVNVQPDYKYAFDCAISAARRDDPRAMALTAKFYDDGTGTTRNKVLSRYWLNQASSRGFGDHKNTNTNRDDLLNMLKYVDLSSTDYMITYSDGSTEIQTFGPDVIGMVVMPVLGSWLESRLRSQEQINGVELIKITGNKRTYAGTVSSQLLSVLLLHKGQKVTLKAQGTMTLGWMLSGIGPFGTSDPKYTAYSITPAINHGAFMCSVGIQQNWTFVGYKNTFFIAEDGFLNLAINDRDYTNNTGYIDFEMEVE